VVLRPRVPCRAVAKDSVAPSTDKAYTSAAPERQLRVYSTAESGVLVRNGAMELGSASSVDGGAMGNLPETDDSRARAVAPTRCPRLFRPSRGPGELEPS
jgi:hypothetical protein